MGQYEFPGPHGVVQCHIISLYAEQELVHVCHLWLIAILNGLLVIEIEGQSLLHHLGPDLWLLCLAGHMRGGHLVGIISLLFLLAFPAPLHEY